MSLPNVVAQKEFAQNVVARNRNPITKFDKRTARYSFMSDDDKYRVNPRINSNLLNTMFVPKESKKSQLNRLTSTRKHPSSTSMKRNTLIGGKRLRRTYKKRR